MSRRPPRQDGTGPAGKEARGPASPCPLTCYPSLGFLTVDADLADLPVEDALGTGRNVGTQFGS